MVDATIGVLHNAITSVLIVFAVTHPHQRSPSHRSSSIHSRDCSRPQSHSAHKASKKTPYKTSSTPSRTPASSQDGRHPHVTIDDPQTDFYSTDDNFSYSEDDEGHLN